MEERSEKTNEEQLLNLIKANARVIQIISYETLRVHALLVNSAKTLKWELYIWNRIDGIQKWDFSQRRLVPEDVDARAPDRPFDFFRRNDKLIFLLEDFHPNLAEGQHEHIKRIRNVAFNQVPDKTMVLSQPFHRLPPELEKEVHIMEIPYPDRRDIMTIYKKVCRDHSIANVGEVLAPDNKLIDAALGLTIMEAEKAFSLALIETGKLTEEQIPLVIREKENVIKKSGHLEYYHAEEKIEDVGGLDILTDWLKKRGRGFEKEAKDFGLDYPKGIMLLGVPGTGKSLTAKAIANLWHFPLLKLDMGKIFGGIVGESERNIREALGIAEAISPSILFIDEIEKGLSGSASSGQTDGGTTSRVLGTFLSWMQDKKKPVFVVATANSLTLPPELLRKGRMDEIFFVDLPTEQEREAILAIHLRKKKRDPAHFDLKKIAKASKGFSGAELEEAIKEALFQAYDDQKRSVVDEDILGAIEKTSPLSKTMYDLINQSRKWAQQGRAVAASSQAPETLDAEKSKQTLRLKVEASNNPFIVEAASNNPFITE
ncbi:putative ATP-dependent zinc metalloprotease FtsH [Pillotina sp. SPG140]|jgi:AAA+ superfamily predicted ATPase